MISCVEKGGVLGWTMYSGDGRGGVGPRTTHLSSKKVDCWLDDGDIFSSHSGFSSISFHFRGKSALPLVDDIKLTVNNTSMNITSCHQFYSENMMGGFGHISVTNQHTLWCNLEVVIIYLVHLVVLNSVFLLVMVEVVWVLGPPNFPPRQFIFSLMVVILFHLRVVIIHP